jgi:hypothetical protein
MAWRPSPAARSTPPAATTSCAPRSSRRARSRSEATDSPPSTSRPPQLAFTTQPLGAYASYIPTDLRVSRSRSSRSSSSATPRGRDLDVRLRAASRCRSPGTPLRRPRRLTCTGGNTVTVSAGVATFAGCSINAAGVNYQLRARPSPPRRRSRPASTSTACSSRSQSVAQISLTTYRRSSRGATPSVDDPVHGRREPLVHAPAPRGDGQWLAERALRDHGQHCRPSSSTRRAVQRPVQGRLQRGRDPRRRTSNLRPSTSVTWSCSGPSGPAPRP